MKKTFTYYVVSVSILLTSCLSTKTFLKNDQIPDDFGKGNKTILIIEPTSKYVNKAVMNAFEKYYKGNYKISGDSKSGSNLGYTFNTYTENSSGSFTSAGRQGPSTDFYFGVTDLQPKKTYKMLRFGNYTKLSKLYVQALEIVRKRNQ